MHDQTSESITITETWTDFDQLPEELQQMLIEAVDSGELELGDGTEPPQQGDGLNFNPDEKGAAAVDAGASQPGGKGSLPGAPEADSELSDEDTSEALGAPDGELDPANS